MSLDSVLFKDKLYTLLEKVQVFSLFLFQKSYNPHKPKGNIYKMFLIYLYILLTFLMMRSILKIEKDFSFMKSPTQIK